MYGGDESAVQLAIFVCHRASYFYERWLDGGCPSLPDLSCYAADYVPSLDFLDWVVGLDIESAEFDMALHLRKFMFPAK